MICAVCGDTGVGVWPSQINGAITTYCGACLALDAEPFALVSELVALAGGPGKAPEWLFDLHTWVNGEHIAVKDYYRGCT